MTPSFINRTVATLSMAFACGAATADIFIGNDPSKGTWVTTLQPRDLDGNLSNGAEAFYDTTLNITWLRDLFAYKTSLQLYTDWAATNSWANALNVNGIDNWRLPKMIDTGAPGCDDSIAGTDCGYNVQTQPSPGAYSELAHMYFVTLGNTSIYAPDYEFQPGYGFENSGPFLSVDKGGWWYGTESAVNPTLEAWVMDGYEGMQGIAFKWAYAQGWAVHDGDVGTAMAVPEPESVALALAGLGVVGFVAARRRKQ